MITQKRPAMSPSGITGLQPLELPLPVRNRWNQVLPGIRDEVLKNNLSVSPSFVYTQRRLKFSCFKLIYCIKKI